MFIYIVFYSIFIPFIVFDYLNLTERSKKKIFLILGILLSLFLGTRIVGPDLQTYKILYDVAPNLYNLPSEFSEYTLISKFEPLFVLLYSVSNSLNISFEAFNLVYSTFFVFLFIYTVPKYTRFSFFAIFIYIGFAYMSGWSALRQFMGASLFFFSLQFLFLEKKWKYLLVVTLACLFHFSAIVLIPLCLVPKKRFKVLWYYVVTFGVLVVYFTGVINIFVSQILGYFPFLDQSKVNSAIESESSLLSSVFILWTLIILLGLLAYKSIKNSVEHFDYFFNILFACYISYILLVGLGGLGRVIMYYKILFPIFIPLFSSMFLKKQRLLFIMGIVFISFYIYINTILEMDEVAEGILDKFIPYKSWLLN